MPGCENNKPATSFPSHLMVNYTGENVGALFPCGCHIPIGGLSRRAGVIKSDSPYFQLTVDTGSFCGGNTGYDRFAGGWILQMYAAMGYDAVNLGVRETAQKISQLREWDTLAEGSLISANLIDDQGLPVTRTHLIREIGGIKIGITGITTQGSRSLDAPELPTVILPVPPLLAVMDEFKNRGVDFVVLLVDVSSGEINTVLNEVPGIDLVVQGQEFNATQVSISQIFGESGRMVRIGGSGKYLGRIRLDFEPDGTVTNDEVMRVDLDSNSPTLSLVTELLIQFKTELLARRTEFLGDPSNPFQRSQAPEFTDILVGYTGEAFCAKCHTGYNLESQFVGHSETWSRRLDEDNQTNPDCLRCHTTGYGIPTGLEDPFRDSHLRGVTCEACHGPAAQHVRDKTAITDGLDTSGFIPYQDPTGIQFHREVPEEVCLGCHTTDRPCFREGSPEFDYATWVERVNHYMARNRPQITNPETGEIITPDFPDDIETQAAE